MDDPKKRQFPIQFALLICNCFLTDGKNYNTLSMPGWWFVQSLIADPSLEAGKVLHIV